MTTSVWLYSVCYYAARTGQRLFGDKGGNVADNKAAIGYFGAIIVGGLLFLASSALALHARRYGDRWHSRIPVVWLDGRAGDGRSPTGHRVRTR